LPNPDKLTIRDVTQSTKIYDRNGQLLYDIFGEAKRTLISFEEMPDVIKKATVAIEDKDFYTHKGIDLSRIFSSIFIDVLTLSKKQGASTITQQLVRNAILTKEKSFARKIKEIVLAMQIERKYSKDEILKLYLNEIPYGNNAYGVQAAAQAYFGKSARDLTLTEAAYLAALPQSPSYYSPWGPNREKLDDRKNTVLRLMKDQNYITEEQRKAAAAEKVTFSPVRNAIKAPHFVLYIQGLLAQKYGEKTLQEGGLQVTTTLDYSLQKSAEEAIAEYADKNEKNYNAKNAALVALDPKTGEILAMVGSKNFFDDKNDGQVNVALRPRQPGSSFKPYVYATAFKQGYSPASMLMDVTTNFGQFGGTDYIPHNYTGKNYGPLSIRQALAGSLNVPAVKTILLVGVKEAINTAHDLGITTLKDESRFGPSLVLGGGEVLLLDHVSAFGTFANAGIHKSPGGILKVVDSQGKVLEEYKEKSGQQVLDPQVAYLVTSILSDNNARSFIFGSRSYLILPDRPVAAKTGTTQEFHDAWTVGFVPQLAAGVWVGNNDNSAMKKGADGSVVAAPIWNSFMKKALSGKPVQGFTRPQGITDVVVDAVSGKLPTQYTPSTKTEVFASFSVPKDYDNIHVPVKIDNATGRVATKDTPTINITEKVFTIFHSEKPNEPNWEQPVRDWTAANNYPYPEGYGATGNQSEDQVYVSLPQPTEGQTFFSLPLTIEAISSASSGIKSTSIYFDDKEIFYDQSASVKFFYSTQAEAGEHTIRIEAVSNSGTKTIVNRKVFYDLAK
ncbi:MAG: PBP1A family penicillin-binding protein, partial [bacterium]|nr:PBP1A family penicillin-binding protein [bacterium]